jgi:hypothetical protein
VYLALGVHGDPTSDRFDERAVGWIISH